MKLPAISGFDPQAFNKYFKNTGWLMLARVGSMAIKVLVTIQIANYLGKDQFGLLSPAIAITSIFVALAALGLDGFVTRELIQHPAKRDILLGTAFRLKVWGALAIFPVIYLTYLLRAYFTGSENPVQFGFILGFTALMQTVNLIDSYFQSRAEGKYIMYVQVAGNLLSALIKIIFISAGLSLIWFVFSFLLDAVLLALGYISMYKLKGNRVSRWTYDSRVAKYLLKSSWPLALSAVLVTIYMKIDILMIEDLLHEGDVGIYATVAGLSESWYFLPVAIVTSVFPAIIYARNTDPQRYQKRLQNMYDLMVVISMSIAVVMTFAAPLVYRIFYAPEYWSGASVLSVHVWAGVFVFLGSASGQYLMAEGYTGLSLLRTGVGAIVNIVLNWYWIPAFGIAGAAYATLAAYFVATFFILLVPKTRKQGIMMLKSLFLISLIQQIPRK